MRRFKILILFLLTGLAIIRGKDGNCGYEAENCEEDEDLSFLEAILLFPLSFTGKPISLPRTEEQSENIFSAVYQLTTVYCVDWITEALSYPGLVTGYLSGCTPDFGWLLDCILSPINAVYNCIGAFPESMLLSTLREFCLTVTECVMNYTSILRDPPSYSDFLRYLVVTVLILTMLPVITLTEKRVRNKRLQKSKRAKTKDETNTPFREKLSKAIQSPPRALSPLLEDSAECSPKPSSINHGCNVTLLGDMYHYPMCEYFDRLPCNCGGKLLQTVSTQSKTFKSPFSTLHGDMYHYPMCEYFDRLPCNCGGKLLQTVSTQSKTFKSPFSTLHGDMYHYPMCEYFDRLPCNCGGKLLQTVSTQSKTLKSPYCLKNNGSSRKHVVSYHPVVQTRAASVVKNKESKSDTRVELTKERFVMDTKPKVRVSDDGHDLAKDITRHVASENADTLINRRHTESSPTAASDEICDTDQDMDDDEFEMSITDIDIGEPCFNSSFKEESMYVIKDIVDPCANGDGPDKSFSPAIVTRRLPVKHSGLSFDEDTEDGADLSYLDRSFEETRSVVEDEEDSLLDVSTLSRSTSMSYMGTDGIIELAVVFLAQTTYRWTKRFLRERRYLRRGNYLSKALQHSTEAGNDRQCNQSKNAVNDREPATEQSSNTGADTVSVYFEPLKDNLGEIAEKVEIIDDLAENLEDLGENNQTGSQIDDCVWEDSCDGTDGDNNLPFVYDNADSRRIISYSDDTSDVPHAADNVNDNDNANDNASAVLVFVQNENGSEKKYHDTDIDIAKEEPVGQLDHDNIDLVPVPVDAMPADNFDAGPAVMDNVGINEIENGHEQIDELDRNVGS